MFRRLTIFGAVGATATAVHVGIAVLLVEQAGIGPVLANLVAFGGALMVSFLGHRRLTFADADRRRGDWLRFSLTALLGLSLNQSIMFVTVSWAGWHYLIGLALVVGFVPLVVFLVCRYWVFPLARV